MKDFPYKLGLKPSHLMANRPNDGIPNKLLFVADFVIGALSGTLRYRDIMLKAYRIITATLLYVQKPKAATTRGVKNVEQSHNQTPNLAGRHGTMVTEQWQWRWLIKGGSPSGAVMIRISGCRISSETPYCIFLNKYDRSCKPNLESSPFPQPVPMGLDTAPLSLFERTHIFVEKTNILYKSRIAGYINVASQFIRYVSMEKEIIPKANQSHMYSSAINGIFSATEKSLYMIYVDLQNAFDRVPHALMQHLIIHIYVTGSTISSPWQSRFNHVAYMDNIKIWTVMDDFSIKIQALIDALQSLVVEANPSKSAVSTEGLRKFRLLYLALTSVAGAIGYFSLCKLWFIFPMLHFYRFRTEESKKKIAAETKREPAPVSKQNSEVSCEHGSQNPLRYSPNLPLAI
ncbi:hypothetical protein RF11_11612 [Thelohanellus kitauei]|uniref:Uncharacterized protein n=1 Tax=Thelohanellus kitauei TaxID=669202 RepID=A0A0C2IP43_THEKT|nr:hypothetical protein RF11_11612 [Thelohanellus kitauei]